MNAGARPGLPTARPGHPAPPDLAQRRAQMAAAVAAGAFATPVPPTEVAPGGVRALRFDPAGPVRAHVLHLHGGGFRLGAPEFAGPFAAALAARCAVRVVAPQYRLAPEAPFPAGLEDAARVLQALRVEAGDAPLIVCGDSAGGGLAAGLCLLGAVDPALRVQGAVLLSPWLDLTVTAPSYAANADRDPLFGAQAARIAAGLYLQGLVADHPLASPLLADETALRGFPPTLISVGKGEVLLDDARRLHARLQRVGRGSRLLELAGMDHVAVVRGADLPGAAETFAAVAGFIDALCPG